MDTLDHLEEYGVSKAPSIIFLRNGHILESIPGSDPTRFRDALDRHAGGVQPIDNSATLVPELTKAVPIARLTELVKAAPVMLFMTGTPSSPRCRLSRRLVGILRGHDIDYDFFDVLADEDVRQGITEFGDWPTFPQLWVDGELVGGLEIVREGLGADPDFIKNHVVRKAAAQEDTNPV
ncbi:glutaredoxin [Aspergillus indologenus CBS 114.80]|uniref:Glutaredoxin n=1 Tax=Aspergillus indologenus CBS 114.80 TaxID=1450541 RepID=A0A2V5IKE1_9EURO|nr:glutaredoxin [Aspergillus indologenus CBS 114.80]